MNDLDNKKRLYLFSTVFTIAVLCAVGLSMMMIYSLLFPKDGDHTANTSEESELREETEEEKKYSVKIYHYYPNDEEIGILKEKGYSVEEIEKLTDDRIVEILYGKEAMINNKYIQKHTSRYRKAKEPSDEEREEILKELVGLYKEAKYEALVTKYGEYQKEYLFEHFRDAPINALYHDADQMLDFSSLSESAQKNKLGQRQSVYSIVYDLNTIGGSIQGSSDMTSCIMLGQISNVVSIDLYENIEDVTEPLYVFPMTDMIYKVGYETVSDGKGTVWIGDRNGSKYLIKVVPEEKCIAQGR